MFKNLRMIAYRCNALSHSLPGKEAFYQLMEATFYHCFSKCVAPFHVGLDKTVLQILYR